MKKIYCLFFLCIFLVGCEKEQKLTFAEVSYKGSNCETCPTSEINLPFAEGEGLEVQKINKEIEAAAIKKICDQQEDKAENIDTAIDHFEESFRQHLIDIDGVPSSKWESIIDGIVSYQSNELIAISLISYCDMGGAHGYDSSTFLNFNRKTGHKLSNKDLFKDQLGFLELAEKKFRAQEKIPNDKNINDTGFWFKKDEFHLPENIGFTEDGILLLYNSYEIAGFAVGPKSMEIPYKEAEKFLRHR